MKFIINKIKDFESFLLGSVVIISTILYSFISIQKHLHFQTFGWDTAVFDQQLYLLTHFKAPIFSMGKMHALGDHFQLLFLIIGTPLYSLYNSPNVLFILQAFVTSLSIVPLYLIAKHLLSQTDITKTYTIIISQILSMSYLFSVSIQSMITDEFHNEPFAAFLFILIIYFIIKRNWFGYWISLVSILITKEIFSLIIIPLGIYLYLTTKELKKSILTSTLGIVTFYLLLFQLMPYLTNTDKYIHFSQGNNPSYLISNFISNPPLPITKFFDHPEKIKTLFASNLSLGFFPLFSPLHLILPVSSLVIRFYDESSVRLYQFNNHYASPFMPLLAASAAFGLKNFIIFIKKRKILSISKLSPLIFLYLFSILIIQDLYFHGPLNSLLKKEFYSWQQWELDAHELINKVPQKEVIASQNSLLPHLSQRDHFYLLPEIGPDTKYIVVDLAPGPNKFAPFSDPEPIKKIIAEQINTKKFEIIWQKNQSILLKRI